MHFCLTNVPPLTTKECIENTVILIQTRDGLLYKYMTNKQETDYSVADAGAWMMDEKHTDFRLVIVWQSIN